MIFKSAWNFIGSTGWWVAVSALWLVSALAGLLTAPAKVLVCHEVKCALQQAGYVMLAKALDALNYVSPALTALATVLLGLFTYLLYKATSGLWHYTRTIERAYVKMSRSSPPGLLLTNPGARVNMQVKNSGHTPANVAGAVLKLETRAKDDALPDPPNYEGALALRDSSAFLAADDEYYLEGVAFELSDKERAKARSDEYCTYLYGYVDYSDAFGVRHRAGYARRYVRERQSNNLVFASGHVYNYDRERVAGFYLRF